MAALLGLAIVIAASALARGGNGSRTFYWGASALGLAGFWLTLSPSSSAYLERTRLGQTPVEIVNLLLLAVAIGGLLGGILYKNRTTTPVR